jgi:hypothetical protein
MIPLHYLLYAHPTYMTEMQPFLFLLNRAPLKQMMKEIKDTAYFRVKR